MKTRNCRLGLFVFLAISSTCAFVQAQTDTIVRRNGNRQERITVVSDQYDKVAFTMSSPDGKVVESSYSADSVADVIYSDAPVEFLAGRNLMEKESYAEALKKFSSAETKTVARPWFKAHLAFSKAACLHRLGRLDDAIGLYQQVTKLDSKSRVSPDAILGAAQCFLSQQKAAEARKLFNELTAGDFSPIYKLNGSLGKAQAGQLGETAELEASLKEFDSLINQFQTEDLRVNLDDERYQEVLIQARIGKGATLVKLKNQSEAESWFEAALVAARNQGFGQARTYNARGDALLALEQPMRALWDYQRVATVYFSDRDAHRHAVTKCVEVFPLTGDAVGAKQYAAILEKSYGERKAVQEVVKPEPDETPEPETAGAAEMAKVIVETPFYVDQKPKGTLKKGQSFEVIKVQGKWANIVGPEGEKGWVPTEKIEIVKAGDDEEPEPEPETEPAAKMVTVTADAAPIYNGAQQVFYTAKKDEKFKIVDESKKAQGWYGIQVEAEGKVTAGWVSAQQVAE